MEIDNKKTVKTINEMKNRFFEKVNRIDNPLAILTKEKREESNKIRNERGGVITDTTEIQMVIKEHYERLCTTKLDNLGEKDKFLESYNLPRLKHEETENLNRPITSKEIKTVKKKTSPKTDGFIGEFYQTFKRDLMFTLLRHFQKIEAEGKLPNSYRKPALP